MIRPLRPPPTPELTALNEVLTLGSPARKSSGLIHIRPPGNVPCGPVAPCGPVGPCEPVGPCGPVWSHWIGISAGFTRLLLFVVDHSQLSVMLFITAVN